MVADLLLGKEATCDYVLYGLYGWLYTHLSYSRIPRVISGEKSFLHWELFFEVVW